MALVCSLLDAREENHRLERQQKELEHNKGLLAIRQAEARKLELELELEHSKVLSAIKQADLESNKDLVAMEETDDQENSDGSEWETDMGSLTLQSTFGTSKATSPTIN